MGGLFSVLAARCLSRWHACRIGVFAYETLGPTRVKDVSGGHPVTSKLHLNRSRGGNIFWLGGGDLAEIHRKVFCSIVARLSSPLRYLKKS